MTAGIVPVKPTGQDGDRVASAGEGGPVRHPVDAVGSQPLSSVLLAGVLGLLKDGVMGITERVSWRLFFYPKRVAVLGNELLRRAFEQGQISDEKFEMPSPLVGRPFFLNDDGDQHVALNRFFSSGRMRNRSEGTNRKYAYSLGVWANFLARQGKDWDTATEEDLLGYKFWRRTDEQNPRPVSGSTWAGDIAALSMFYDWAQRNLNGPDLLGGADIRGARRYAGHAIAGVSLQASTVRGADVKWLSPGAYRRWRDVGIHGIEVNGAERSRWRPRSQSRDAAFVDGIYGSGLRLQEWASILTTELREPAPNREYVTLHLADACAKGQRGHPYWLKRQTLNSVAVYVETERAMAIRRAQASGLYERLPAVRVVDSVNTKGRARITDMDGAFVRTANLNQLDPDQRRSLFVREKDGLAPLMLWLNEDGSPRPKRAWYKSFTQANHRVHRAGIERLECHPHMLRHSFALRWYAVGRLIWEQRDAGLTNNHALDFRQQFGDTWALVQTKLGHSNVETTRSIYLEPFLTLDVQLILQCGLSEVDTELLLQVLRTNPRVRLAEPFEIGATE